MNFNSNRFEITGRVGYVKLTALSNGNSMIRVLISKKSRKEGEYDTYGINFFGDVAEQIAQMIQKGDTINAVGRIDYNKYKDKLGNEREELRLVGNEYTKVVYDESKRDYVAVNEVTTKAPWD